MCCYYYSKSREVSRFWNYRQWYSEDLDATQHLRRRSLVPTAHVLSRNTVGYHMLVYIYTFINHYLPEHRSTFDNCIVKVDYGIFNIQPSNQLSNIAFYNKRLMLSVGRRWTGFEATRLDFASALCVSSGLFFTLSRIETYVIDNVLSVKSTITLHSTAHTNHTSYKNLLHAPMFTLTVKMSLQMFYSNILAHMPSASSVQFRLDNIIIHWLNTIIHHIVMVWLLK